MATDQATKRGDRSTTISGPVAISGGGIDAIGETLKNRYGQESMAVFNSETNELLGSIDLSLKKIELHLSLASDKELTYSDTQ